MYVHIYNPDAKEGMCLKPPPSPSYSVNSHNHMCSTAINITSPLGSIAADARIPASADGIMSLQEDVVHFREQAPTIDEIGSPTSDQIFEFCETDIFPAETFQSSDVTCSSNCCCYDQDINSSSYTANISSFPPSNTSPLDQDFSSCHHDHDHDHQHYPSFLRDMKGQLQQNQVDQKYSNTTTTTSSSTNTTPNTSSITATTTTAPPPPAATGANNYNNSCYNVSIIFDSSQDHEIDNDISASIDFSPSSQFPSTPPPVPYLPNPTGSSSSTPITTTRQEDYVSRLDLIPSVQMLQHQPLTHASAAVSGPTARFPAPVDHPQLVPPHLMMPPPPLLLPVFEEDCLSSIDIPPLLRFDSASSCNFMDPAAASFMMPTSAALNGSFPGGGIYSGSSSTSNTGSVLVGQAAGEVLQPKEQRQLDHYQGDNAGIFYPDHHQQLTTTRNVFNSGDIEAFSSNIDGQHLVNGAAATSSAHLTTADLQISAAGGGGGLEDPTFKVGKLSVEQRREKIHRYMKKRNERNFSKKIKYACRKTLADSRPRVRGRFAKNNDDFRGNHHHHHHHHRHVINNDGNHHHDEDGDYYDHHEVTHHGKEEDVMVDSSELFAHISGVNSYKFHAYPIQSWN